MKEIEEFYNTIKDIKYGWHDIDGNIHEHLKDYKDKYIQQSIDKNIEDNYAVCWEMCEIQRNFFNKHNIKNKTIFAYLNNSRNQACHTFSVIFNNNKCYWFEASWQNNKGIHEFDTLEDVLEYYRDNFYDFARSDYDRSNMLFFDYDGIVPGMRAEEFYMHCMNSKLLS